MNLTSLRQSPLLSAIGRYVESLPPAIHGLALSVFINRVGGAAKAFFALYLHEARGIPLTTVGFLLALYGAGVFAGGYLMGILSDRLPTRRLIIAVLAGSGLSLLALGAAEPIWLIGTLLLTGGLLDGGFRPLNQRLIMEVSAEHQRRRAQATVRAALNLGVGVAGLVSGWLASVGYGWIFLADGCSSLLAATLLYRLLRHLPAPAVSQAGSQQQAGRLPYQDGPFLLLLASALILAIIYDQFYSTYGAYLRMAYQLSPIWVGYMYSLNGLMVGLLQIPLTVWTDRFGYRLNAMLGAAMLTGGFFLLPFGRGALYLTLTTLIWTTGELLLMPQQQALVMRRAETGRSGHYFGLYAAVWGGRGFLAPAIGTQIYAHFGGNAVWYACGVAGILAIGLQQRAFSGLLGRR
ncbi:MFS transporter [Parachitinimonas caeni]|uniref:MFS transporter n=1 Tax=Parachitinimonas caeni TaxID=3031301 RepID=A0ABT7DS72_9NEIS|nr:MFS transporter [Parachitinimonas caeni]MDK2122914.1 MFS transporter [Parachitinimonas caeni]